MANCSLKLFRLWLGVTEYLFRNPRLLDEALDTAIDDKTFRSDDLEFTFAARVSAQSRAMVLSAVISRGSRLLMLSS